MSPDTLDVLRRLVQALLIERDRMVQGEARNRLDRVAGELMAFIANEEEIRAAVGRAFPEGSR